MKKRSLLFVEFHSDSGSVNGLLAELEYLKAHHSQDFETIVISPPDSLLRKYNGVFDFFYAKKAYELSGIYDHPIKILVNYFSTVFFIVNIALKHRVYLIHCNNYFWSPQANLAGFLSRKQVVVHLKDVLLLEPRLARILMKFNKKTMYIAVSKYVKKLFSTEFKVKKEKIVTIYDGISSQIFTYCGEEKAKKKFHQSNKKIIMMSRVAPTRGIEVFIETAALLTKKYPKIVFLHYGYLKKHVDKKYFSELERRINSLGLKGRFILKDYEADRRKIANILQSAFLSIIPARTFALPNTMIESMMCGTPSVANNIGGNPEIIINNSVGKLVLTDSPLLFVPAIESYIQNENDYLKASIQGSKITHDKFSAEKIYGKFVSFYKSLLGI
jgi:glycosyltransferase involved in cell wall biosynthesis